jgi:hypothetical protein
MLLLLRIPTTSNWSLWRGGGVPCYPDARCLHARQVCVLSSFSSADLEPCVAKAHGVDTQAGGISTAAVVAIVIGAVVVAGTAAAMPFRPVNTNAIDHDDDDDDIQIELRVSERDMPSVKGQQQRVCQIRKLNQHKTQETAGQERLMFRFCMPSLAYTTPSTKGRWGLEMRDVTRARAHAPRRRRRRVFAPLIWTSVNYALVHRPSFIMNHVITDRGSWHAAQIELPCRQQGLPLNFNWSRDLTAPRSGRNQPQCTA